VNGSLPLLGQSISGSRQSGDCTSSAEHPEMWMTCPRRRKVRYFNHEAERTSCLGYS
jgi:hypothetical protein